MFGHRGLVQDGWKAVAFHPLGSSFDQDKWELFHLDHDFSETDDLAAQEPARLKAMIAEWWKQAEAHQVLPLDDRFAPRFADNAKRFHGPRKHFVFHAGMGHVPTDVAPDVRSRSYTIEADARVDGGDRGRADRPWRHDLRLRALHQGRPPDLRHERRRRASHRRLRPAGAAGQPPARRADAAQGQAAMSRPC